MATSMSELILVIWFMSTVQSVDRGNFKTCDMSGFCKRQRAYKPDVSPYVALLDSVKISQTKVQLQLLNTKNNIRLHVDVTAIEPNTARIKINELNPIKPRFEIPDDDVVLKSLQERSLQVLHKDATSISLGFKDNKLIIQSEPFRVDIVVNNEPVISLNAKHLLKFEHLRLKETESPPPEVETPPPPPEDSEAPLPEDNAEEKVEEKKEEAVAEEEKKDEEPDQWEETFKSHEDSKPNGPSSIGLDIGFPGVEHVYGIPEHADTLALKSTTGGDPYRLYNLDVFEYELHNPMALYGSVPVMLAHNEKRTVGVFWNNAAETWVDISNNVADKTMLSKVVDFVKGSEDMPIVDTHWFSESGIIDLFIMLGPTPQDVFYQYSKITGTTALPPLFAIAYHQSRWNYNDEEDVKSVDAKFDEHDIPCDVIWLDIEHTDGKRYFTWDNQRFSHPKQMIEHVSGKGRKIVTIIDPHIKRDDNYKIHKEATERDLYIKSKDGSVYENWCWPGTSSWLDFLNPDIRKYWSDKFSLNEYDGSTLDLYTWNDMNEPSVFSGPEITMHKDCKHYGGWEHRDIHNIYGLYNHMASAQGQVQRSDSTLRPFVLSRAFFAGSQRWGAIWTGDNTAEWGHLKISSPMILSLSLVGITFSGADVGGFFKNPDTELLTRWYQIGAYQPFFRAHAHLDTKRREPWLLPEENMKIIRGAIRARYALLPYWYTLFYDGEKTGNPVMRPLWVEFPTEKAIFSEEDTYMLGSALLVHPITEPGSTGVNIYFPGQGQVFYDVDTYQYYPGGETHYIPATLSKIPVFQRGGSIVPRKERIRRASNLGRNDPYTLTICLDNQEHASGKLYIDDYHSFQYQKGSYSYREFTFEKNILSNKNADSNGIYDTSSWLEKVIIVGIKAKPSGIDVSSKSVYTKPLEYTYDTSKQVLTIRNPKVAINQDWDISLH